jgi:hypothetical protein
MYNILIKISNLSIATKHKNSFHLMAMRKKNMIFAFSTSKGESPINKESINDEKIKKQQQI